MRLACTFILVSAALALSGAARGQGAPAAKSPAAKAPPTKSPPAEAPPAKAPPAQTTPPAEAAPPAEAPPAEPQKRTTGIRGRVTDPSVGEGLFESLVTATGPVTASVKADQAGNYELVLKPGTYTVLVTLPTYAAKRLKNIMVKEGEATALDVGLELDLTMAPVQTEQTILIEAAAAEPKSEAAVLEARRGGVAIMDAVSAQEISRTPDSSASDAVKRVVSVTVVDGRQVFMRGLGGRYAAVLVNGIQLPAPETDEASVSLDIFPTQLLANMLVVKAYRPDLPGTFAGGALLLNTNSYPGAFEFRLRLGTSFDSQATGQKLNTYEGGSLDYLGFQGGSRQIPDPVPGDRPLVSGMRTGYTDDQVAQIGKSFENNWVVKRKTGLPNLTLGASLGETIKLSSGRFGYLAAFNLAHSTRVRRATTQLASRDDPRGVFANETLKVDAGVEQGYVNGLLNLGYNPSSDHTLNFFSFFTHDGTVEAQRGTGFKEQDNQNVDTTRQRFTARTITFYQLQGEHHFAPGGHDYQLDWQGNFAATYRDEPDTRDLTYNEDPQTGVKRLAIRSGSGERFFSNLSEYQYGGRANGATLVPGAQLRLGGTAQASTRQFNARRFRIEQAGMDPLVLQEPPSQIFRPDAIGPNFRYIEATLPADSYKADRNVYAAYGSVDVTALQPVRVIAGMRFERSDQSIVPGTTPFGVGSPARAADRAENAFLPSLNLLYQITDSMNVRAAYSRTLARASLRELGPFLYFDYGRRRSVSGNPALVESRIDNVDLRWEMFPTDNEVLAVTGFFKNFNDPIEQVITNATQGDVSFVNTPGARGYGVELEARIGLHHIAEPLAPFKVGFNATVMDSKIDLGSNQGAQTSKDRPLQGQSRYIVNYSLSYLLQKTETEGTVSYNVSSERISDVGIQGLPDIYEQPFHKLDLAVMQRIGQQLTVKLSGGNLLDSTIQLKQGNNVTPLEYKPGVSGFLSAELTN